MRAKTLDGIYLGSPMGVASGQQHNIGEKSTVVLYTYTIAMQNNPQKKAKVDAEEK